MLEATRRAPLIVRVPGAPANGRVCREIVEFVDLVPTLGELARLDLPGNLEGASFVPLLKDPQRSWKKAAFTQVGRGKGIMGRSVRTERYRYTEWGDEKVAELYDHEVDIHEFRNLARDPKARKLQEQMRRMLHAGWKAALP